MDLKGEVTLSYKAIVVLIVAKWIHRPFSKARKAGASMSAAPALLAFYLFLFLFFFLCPDFYGRYDKRPFPPRQP